jgi:ABC-type Na+ transport system ATPase subunit NatA
MSIIGDNSTGKSTNLRIRFSVLQSKYKSSSQPARRW